MQQTKLLYNALFFTGSELVKEKALVIRGDRIEGFTDPGAGSLSSDVKAINCEGALVAAGLIDLQIAGGGGHLFSSSPTPEAIDQIAASIVATGTTGFLMAMPTNSYDVYHSAFKSVSTHMHPALLGLHLEGPFISHAKRGAHPAELIKEATPENVRELISKAGGSIAMMTVAPELCSQEVISILKENGITVAAGHSNATFREAESGFEMGIETTTHLYNAMTPFHHRDPGLPGATFLSDNAMASIIADGIHVDYHALSIAKRVMGERLFLVSDAVEESNSGAYLHVRQEERYTLPDGTLSGARLTMLEAVRNAVRHAGIDKYEALRMASLYPARLIKTSERGIIAPGARADLVIIDDELRLKNIVFNGTLIREN